MARHKPRHRIKRQGNKKRLALKEPILDPLVEVKLSDFVKGRHHSTLLKSKGGVKMFFLQGQNYRLHELAQENYRDRYVAGLLVLHMNNVKLDPAALYFGLAAAWGRHDHELAEALMSASPLITAAEVLKALSILDIGRRLRAANKRIKRLELSRVSLKKYKMPNSNDFKDYHKIRPVTMTASGALCRHIRRWARRLSEADLRQYITQQPEKDIPNRQVWRKLADICHFNPAKDFAALPWFMAYIYGNHKLPSPKTYDLRALNVNQHVLEEDVPLSAVEKAGLMLCLRPEAKERIVLYTDLGTVLEHLADLLCQETEEVVCQRLAAEGDSLGVENGVRQIAPILNYIALLLKVRMNNPTELVKLKMDDEVGFEAMYEQTNADVGLKVLQALTNILERRLAATREVLRAHVLGPVEVICDNNAEGEQDSMFWGAPQDESTSLEPALLSSTLAALTGGRLYGAEKIVQEEKEGQWPSSAAEVVAMGETYVRGHLKTGQGVGYVKRLYNERRVVEVIVLVVKQGIMYMAEYFKELVDILEKYTKEVHPALVVVIQSGRFEYRLLETLKASGVRYLDFKSTSKKENTPSVDAVDAIVKVATSTFTRLKTIDEQIDEATEIVKEWDIEDVFRLVF